MGSIRTILSVGFISLSICLSTIDASHGKADGIQADPWEDDMRLPADTYAQHYDLYLHPDLETKNFYGNATVTISTTTTRDHFLIHEKLLTISRTSLFNVDGGGRVEVPVLDAFEYSPNEFWVVRTAENVTAGTYELELDFNGYLGDKIIGFYYSEYETEDNITIPLATTKFQPTYARQAFPCFDEPSFRSTYNITVVRPSDNNYIGLSNMPILNEVSDTPSPGLTEVTFEKSASMVSYLVCFIVSDFVYTERILPNSLTFRVYAPVDKLQDMQLSLDFGAQCIEYFEELFDLPFPLPKLDMAAIPDYVSGATEHWGLITYRESRIVYNDNESSISQKLSVESVIAHELAHQWFGNLVTLLWWDDLWLNEGFATYNSYKGVDNYNSTEFDMKATILIWNLQDVFNLDSKLSSHPIIQVVETPDEITAIFDSISYDKGASVLRMLEDFMSSAYFEAGINSFLQNYAYQNAITQNLYDELTAAWIDNVPPGDKSDIGIIMDTWTRQMGYPVITVVRSGPTAITLTQERFLQDPNAVYNASDSVYGYKWDVPVSIITSTNSTIQKAWLYREMDSLSMATDADATWFKINVYQMGYYRVNYEPSNWIELEALCASLSLDARDRSSLYDDAFSLASAGHLDYSVAFNLSRSLVSEDHYVPWTSAEGKFKEMDYLFLETNVTTAFREFVREVVGPSYSVLEWEDGGTTMEGMLRSVIVDLASRAELTESLTEAGTLFQAWIDDVNFELPINTKVDIYWWGMINSGSSNNWNIMWDRCIAELDASERNNLYYGLANAQDEAILSQYVTLAQDENNVRSQDFLGILEDISRNPAGTDFIWQWVRDNWEWLVDRYTLNDRNLGDLIPTITRYFATTERLNEMEAFFDAYPDAGAGEMDRQQALEQVESNIYWVQAYSQVIQDWLSSR